MTPVTLRPLTMGEILDQAFGLYREQFGELMTVSVICSGIPALFNLVVQARGGFLLAPILALVGLVLSVIGSAVATGASTFVVSGAYVSRAVSSREALRRAVPRIGQLVACSFLFGLLVGVGFVLVFVPGFVLLSGCILCFTALVVEGLGAQAAVGRSWELTRGFRWRMLGLLFVFFIVFYIPFFAIALVAGVTGALAPVAAGASASRGLLLVSVGGAVLQIVLYPFLYCILVTAYYDLRVRKEGFDLELLAQSLAPAGA